MATVGNTYLTLADKIKREDPDGGVADIIEMLSEVNPILEDAMTVECNDGTKHLTTIRAGLPSAVWRKLYEGVPPSKSQTKQVSDATGMLESWSEVDSKLVDMNNDPAAFRLSEARAFLEAMSQTMATTLIYGNIDTDPEKFMGLAPRYSDTSAVNGDQVVLADGSASGSDQTSLWMVTWGENDAHLLYPEGSQAGLQRDDKGEVTKEDSNGHLYDVYREKFEWDLGLTVRDYRNVVRIANVDTSTLSDDPSSSGADLLNAMIEGYYQLNKIFEMGSSGQGNTVIYCNRKVAQFLHKQAKNAATDLSIDEVNGKPYTNFLGIPVRVVDAITNSEAVVS
jgi:hypothetical protein